MNKKSSRLMFVSAMAIFGTLAPFVRNIGVSSAELSLYRALLAASLIGIFLLVTKRPLPVKELKKELLLLMCSGACMAVNWILLFEAYKYTTVAIATLSYYFAPVIVTAVCPILFREKLSGRQLLCFGMSTVGLILITISGDGPGSDGIRGILLGLGAACFYASVVLLNKYIRNVSGLQRTFLQFLAAAAVLIPYVVFSGGTELTSLRSVGWANLLIVGLVHTGLAYCLYFSCAERLNAQTLAIYSYIDPVLALVLSALILKEDMSLLKLLGAVLVIAAALISELPEKRKSSAGI